MANQPKKLTDPTDEAMTAIQQVLSVSDAPTDEHPVRIEFWGDDVEEIRTFAVADQRTIATVNRLWAPPCRELLLTPEESRPPEILQRANALVAKLDPSLPPPR